MPLNTREVLLVVRAKDQASRIISQVSGSFGGLTSQMSTLKNAQSGLQLEKEAQKFDVLGQAIGTQTQDLAVLEAQIRTTSAMKAAGVQVDNEALSAAKVEAAQRNEDLLALKNEAGNRAAVIDQQMLGNSQTMQGINLQQQEQAANFQSSIAMTAMGAASILAGAAILKMYAGGITAAIAYETQSRKTLTQISGFQTTLKDVEALGLQVAREIPIPIEQIQAGLFDIFSSIPVGNMQDAKTILEQMSKAAVGGATDLQTVARSNFEIMNAFGLKTTDLNHLLDVQFKLVQLGIGDYADINTGIGRLAPTAKTAGQSIDTLGGTLAFMTRITGNGSEAITGVQRAMESITNPKVQTALKGFGVTVADSFGNFRPFPDIVNDLANKLSKLSPEAKAAAIFDIFRGTGSGSKNTRQFFMAAIDNLGAFNDTINQVDNNAGSMDAAFKTMSEGTGARIQQLKNNFAAARIELGERLTPAFNKLIEVVTKVLSWFNNLTETQKKWIVIGGLVAATILIVVGIVLVFIGVIGMLSFAFAALDLALLPIIGTILIVVAVIAVLIIIGIVLWKNWDTIKEKASELWQIMLTVWRAVRDAVVEAATTAWNKLQEFWGWVTATFAHIWDNLVNWTTTAWDAVVSAITAAWNWIVNLLTGGNLEKIFHTLVTEVSNVASEVWQTLQALGHDFMVFSNEIIDAVKTLWPFVVDAWKIITAWTEFSVNTVIAVVQFAWGMIVAWTKAIWPIISSIVISSWQLTVDQVKIGIDFMLFVIQAGLGVIVAIWSFTWPWISTVLSAAWDFITALVQAAIIIVSNIIQLVLNIIQGDWSGAWDNIKNIFVAAWNAIWAALQFVVAIIIGFFVQMPMNIVSALGDLLSLLWNKGSDLLTGMYNGIVSMLLTILSFFWGLPGQILDGLANIGSALFNKGVDLIQGFIDGVKSMAGKAASAVGDALNNIPGVGTIRSLTGLAVGGIITKPTIAILGEHSRKEVVIPLTNRARALQLMQQSGLMDMVPPTITGRAMPMSNGGGTTINIEAGAVQISGVSDAGEAAKLVDENMRKLLRELQVS